MKYSVLMGMKIQVPRYNKTGLSNWCQSLRRTPTKTAASFIVCYFMPITFYLDSKLKLDVEGAGLRQAPLFAKKHTKPVLLYIYTPLRYFT